MYYVRRHESHCGTEPASAPRWSWQRPAPVTSPAAPTVTSNDCVVLCATRWWLHGIWFTRHWGKHDTVLMTAWHQSHQTLGQAWHRGKHDTVACSKQCQSLSHCRLSRVSYTLQSPGRPYCQGCLRMLDPALVRGSLAPSQQHENMAQGFSEVWVQYSANTPSPYRLCSLEYFLHENCCAPLQLGCPALT